MCTVTSEADAANGADGGELCHCVCVAPKGLGPLPRVLCSDPQQLSGPSAFCCPPSCTLFQHLPNSWVFCPRHPSNPLPSCREGRFLGLIPPSPSQAGGRVGSWVSGKDAPGNFCCLGLSWVLMHGFPEVTLGGASALLTPFTEESTRLRGVQGLSGA